MNSGFNSAAEAFYDTRPKPFPWLNVLLFLATCFTTLLVGTFLLAEWRGADIDRTISGLWNAPLSILQGLPFSLTVMSILFSHEMGHYLFCRYYGIDASLPYFIPFPNLLGTMGAFIRIRSPIPNRGSLLDVGVAGPIAGFVVAVGALIVSIGYGRFAPAYMPDSMQLGEPLIFKGIEWLMGMNPPPGMDIYLHPVSLAAWFGFLLTALNLLPAAQLDGGHIAYAIFQRSHKWISLGVVATLIPLTIFYWPVWAVWIALLLILRLGHPPTLDDSIPLRLRHRVLGAIGLILFVLCFTPSPISFQ